MNVVLVFTIAKSYAKKCQIDNQVQIVLLGNFNIVFC